MNDFLTFRKMITPVVIQVIFWLGVLACVVGGLGWIVAGATASYGGGRAVLWGLFILVAGPFFVRIYCELLIVIFRINDTLTDVRDALRKK